ncbi:hypothetical protein [Streptomyces sp. NPDC047071]|uniref:hypothetical protein n=1 Tax=Streptomyces sp. NPDC047071 TaxID=3154808 RepID=UPI003454D711
MTKRTTTAKTRPPRATKAKAPKDTTGPATGGLPEDAALDAFGLDSGTALAAFAPRPPAPSAETPEPAAADDSQEPQAPSAAPAAGAQPTAPRDAAPAKATQTPAPQTAAARHEAAPRAATAADNAPGPCTIIVRRDVRERFRNYQTATRAQTGTEPTNAVVVKRAFLHAHKHNLWAQLREDVRHRQQPAQQEDDDPLGLFGDVPARRVDRGGVKHGVQQSFRPSPQELAVYDSHATAHGFDNRSDFLDAVLEVFLPPLPARRLPR